MEQLSIFHELGFLEDPIYRKISTLTFEDVFIIDEISVSKNIKGLYELSSDEFHEVYKNLESCYQKLISTLCPLKKRAFN